MKRLRNFGGLLLLIVSAALASAAMAQSAPARPAAARAKATQAAALEPRAMDVLRAMSTTLTGAQSMAFTAVATYESPSRVGPPLAYFTTSEVLMQRPDKLRVVTVGDGPAAEYYYDGKSLMAYAPAEKLVAVAPAPPSIDAMLESAFKSAAIYFPFADIVGSDPYKLISEGLSKAFYVGQSKVVDGTTTDVLALVNGEMFMQLWVGSSDHLPRKMRVVYRGDPLRLRHEVTLSNWKLDPVIAANAFASLDARNATPITFASPKAPAGARKAAKAPKTTAP
ncbi:DUF2092 domain-containing protein [Variovorax sp. J22P168]|uniref:DUF2092 domain-containing protein n=1 Tax=Variovorax jilinensis TaxID=3053513 RepID=UPI0025762597|nr:DUF2092 domain-containing protein [Variovorax sp. J22P168]MDM0012131.1 DUF2092 domain-containing protein [Variovorax sp. J22P168]